MLFSQTNPRWIVGAVVIAAWVAVPCIGVRADEVAVARPASLSIQGGGIDEQTAGEAVLHGPDARLQLVVTGRTSSGEARDWTHRVEYTAAPADVVRVDPSGAVVPLADGEAVVTAKDPAGVTATFSISVTQFKQPAPIN